ncbi:MAG TPA: DNA-3-methyladenine glycosylase 2 family protein [Candidatus Limnocylindria bacterium]|nr:DNA-3-methyladenine glycosylase 2 family protein [Candidatus Limnocylindria bacterium]
MGPQVILSLDQHELNRGVLALAEMDADLRDVVTRHGPPPLWDREPGFSTLLRIILEQQVSLASARAAYERLLGVVSPVTPAALLALDDAALRGAGFSRQKAAYARELAATLVDGTFDLDGLENKGDDDVRVDLTRLRGIGTWSADIYLLMALRRSDVWPRSDLALATAAAEVKKLKTRPSPDELESLASGWRPWRAVAARILWHHYLSTRRRI